MGLGQVPGKSLPLSARPRIDPEIQKTLTDMPPPVSLDRMLDRPVLRAADAVAHLGLSKALEQTLSLRIQAEAQSSQNQLVFQKALHATMLESGLPADLQGVIAARATRFYRGQLQKSERKEVWTLGELAELKKSARNKVAKPVAPGHLPPPTAGQAEDEAARKKKAQEESGISAPKNPGMEKAYPKLYLPGEKSRTKKLQKEEQLDDPELQKAGGEGSRGGKVIGHTHTGKPVYDSFKHKAHAAFTPEEHHSAARVAGDHARKTGQKKESGQYLQAQKHNKAGASAVIVGSKDGKPLYKAFEPGGKYVARVKHEGKTRYYYDEDEYKKKHGEHVTGQQAREMHIHDSVKACVDEAGDGGCDVASFRELVKKYGAQPVHASVKKHVDEGAIAFKGGRFTSAKKSKDKVKKSAFFIREK